MAQQAKPGQKRKMKRHTSNENVVPEVTLVGSEPSEEETRRRAYELHLGRSGRAPNPVADWLQAEQSLREERMQRKEAVEGEAAGRGRGRGGDGSRGAGRGRRRSRSG